MNSNPNASVATAAGAFTVLVAYVASLFGIELPQLVQGAVTTLVIAAVLYVGKKRPTSTSA